MMSTVTKDYFSSSQKITGILFAFVAAIGFSAKAILVKLAYVDGVDAISLLALRMAFSLPFFLIVAVMENRNKRSQALTSKDKLAVVGLGLIGYYLASYLDFLGLQYISAGLERLILFLYPTMVVLITALVFKHRIGRSVLFALLISYSGIALVYWHDMQVLQHDALSGSLLVFASAMAYAVYLVGAGHTIAEDRRDPLHRLCADCSVCRMFVAIRCHASCCGLESFLQSLWAESRRWRCSQPCCRIPAGCGDAPYRIDAHLDDRLDRTGLDHFSGVCVPR